MIVLDTSFIIDLHRGSDSVRSMLEEIRGKSIAVTIISFFEIFSGLRHRRAKDEERYFRRFFSTVRLLNLDRPGAEEASRIMGELMRIGSQVNVLDVIIAGVAVANGAEEIISKDEDFFEIAKVADLVVKTY
ncbi:MAG: PIN domain-containing protein [Candidatus Bathyarchaeia archaeon]